MLKHVIDFVMSRAGFAKREDALREINFAWVEIWNSDDMPNSVFEITVKPDDSNPLISLPWYVGVLRGVRLNASKERVHLYTPRPYYQDQHYFQSQYTWKVMGTRPLMRSIINATTMTFTIDKPEASVFNVYAVGPTDSASEDNETITFQPGETSMPCTKRFTDLTSLTKDAFTLTDVNIIGANGEELGIIPNVEWEARNTIVQLTDRCIIESNFCRCFDILYKKVAPILYNEYSTVPNEEVLMTKTMEWISLPKEGQEQKALLYGTKSATLLSNFNNNVSSIEKRLDLAENKFCSRYWGYL